MKYVLGCLFSAVMASALTVLFLSPRGEGVLNAQDTPGGPRLPAPAGPPKARPAGPVLSSPPGTAKVPGAPLVEGPGLVPGLEDDADEFGADDLTPEERNNVAVYEQVNRSVAHITTKGSRTDGLFLVDVPTEGAGSGSVIDKNGHILTNYHVIEEARQVNVTLFDGKSYDARFVGADPVNDLAVIRIEANAESLFPVAFGDSRRLKVGQRVFAIGNPFGLERTLTTGIISSLNRSLQIHNNRTIKQIIQIDAAINPGNSGGPLLDSHARLIGINTAIASKTGQSSGVGFAIPISLAARIVPQLIQHGKVLRPEIGITRVFETEHGLLVARLMAGGPAEKAGLQGPTVQQRRRGPFVVEQIDRTAADLIIAIDDQKVTSVDDLLGYIESLSPGAQVTLTIIRQGKSMKLPVTLTATAEPEQDPNGQ